MTWPELGAIHILALDLFTAARCAWYGDDPVSAKTHWIALSRADKDRWIEEARLVLETHRPYPLRSEHAPREIATGLRPTHGPVIGSIGPTGGAA